MKKNIRVALNFATFPAKDVNSLAILVIVCLKNNLLFASLPVALMVLQSLQTALQDAITASAQGGTVNTALKNEAQDAMISALRQTAAYIQSLAPTLTLSQVLTSGFDVVNPNTTPMPLEQPVFTLDNSTTAQLAVYLQAVTNAKAYQVQFSTGAGLWLEAGIYPNTKNIVLKNLTPGTTYNVRIRAVGGSTQYSDWSATVSLMAT
jgi:Flp pilus assembly protein TadG